jgi:glycosidase
LYRVVGRERVGRGRYARFRVLFSTPWPRRARSLYLVSVFTSMFPGRVEMERVGGRGVADVLLWEGEYPYLFSVNAREPLLDEENERRTRFSQVGWGGEVEASLASIGVEEYRAAANNERDWTDLVVHDERSPVFALRLNGSTIIRLHLPRGVVDGVALRYRKGGWWGEETMEPAGEDGLKSYYEAVVSGEAYEYYFVLERDGRRVPWGDEGLGSEKPIRLASGIFHARSWWVGAVFYSIFVDSFARGRDGAEVEEAGARQRKPRLYGGDLWGIASRASHLEELGVDAVYLTPIYPSPSYHRYDVIDHGRVDPLLGGEEAFDNLVRELGRRGIRLVLELVAHHTSPCNPGFSKILASPEKLQASIYRFLVSSIREVDGRTLGLLRGYVEAGCRDLPGELGSVEPFYEAFFGLWSMPKLDHGKAETRRYVKSLISRWLRAGVDGFRVDVGHAIPDEALEEYYRHAKRIRRDAFFAVEISAGLEHYPVGVSMDSGTNYDLRDLILKFTVTREISAVEFANGVARQYFRLPLHASLSLLNLLGSHDTPRVRTIARHCYPRCVKAAYALLFTLPGSPVIYYGDEVGMEGGADPDNRRPMSWDRSRWDINIYEFVRRLAGLRRGSKALKYGHLRIRAVDADTVRITRFYGSELVEAYIARDKEVTVGIPQARSVYFGRRSGHREYSTVDGLLVVKRAAEGNRSIPYS